MKKERKKERKKTGEVKWKKKKSLINKQIKERKKQTK